MVLETGFSRGPIGPKVEVPAESLGDTKHDSVTGVQPGDSPTDLEGVDPLCRNWVVNPLTNSHVIGLSSAAQSPLTGLSSCHLPIGLHSNGNLGSDI